jgi:F-type H+-transporting ATPase subunit epsilon
MLKLSIIAKDKITYEGDAEAVFVPTTTGLIEVLPMHMQLVSTLSKGEILVKANNAEQKFIISGGVLEVRPNNNVIILVS